MSEYNSKTEQGKAMEFVPQKHSLHSVELANSKAVKDPFDKEIIAICLDQGKMAAVEYCKTHNDLTYANSKRYVESLLAKHSLKNKKEGCFIATICYGNYHSREVLILREYRDTVIACSSVGRLFIKSYYAVSPVIARCISRSERVKLFLRVYFLNHIVDKVEKKIKNTTPKL